MKTSVEIPPLIIRSLAGIPLIGPGDDLVEIIFRAVCDSCITLENNDILVIAQKIVSKAEGRLVNLGQVEPSAQAIKVAAATQKDARFVELVLQESRDVLRARPGVLIIEHKLGFICANAGIDHSNVQGPWGDPLEWVLLLPEDPDQSAKDIKTGLEAICGVELGVMIIDSHGRAWRQGTLGCVIGLAGVPGLVDLRGVNDLFGFQLRVTEVAAADELAASASLVMGQAREGNPVVHVRGFPYDLRESCLAELIRPKEQDLFRL